MRERKHPARLFVLLALGLGIALVGVLALRFTAVRRVSAQRSQLARAAEAGPRVVVTEAKAGPVTRTTVLPGDVRAFYEVQLTARISGYVKRIDVDVGGRVSEGQVLALLESPQLEEQVRSAWADYQNKLRIAQRLRRLIHSQYVSTQDYEQAAATAQVAKATYESSRAALAYSVLRAPFSGVVTARYVDPGALLQPGTPMIELRDADHLRVNLYVGQDLAPFLRVGDPAEVVQDELPDRVIHARVSRLAGGLDDASRTMLVELWLDNRIARLVPGVFVHVTLHVQAPPLPSVPTEALMTRNGRSLVAVVENKRIRFQEVELGLNEGTTVQIRRGLRAGQLVALSPPTELRDNAPIEPVRAPPTPASAPTRSARTPAPR